MTIVNNNYFTRENDRRKEVNEKIEKTKRTRFIKKKRRFNFIYIREKIKKRKKRKK